MKQLVTLLTAFLAGCAPVAVNRGFDVERIETKMIESGSTPDGYTYTCRYIELKKNGTASGSDLFIAEKISPKEFVHYALRFPAYVWDVERATSGRLRVTLFPSINVADHDWIWKFDDPDKGTRKCIMYNMGYEIDENRYAELVSLVPGLSVDLAKNVGERDTVRFDYDKSTYTILPYSRIKRIFTTKVNVFDSLLQAGCETCNCPF